MKVVFSGIIHQPSWPGGEPRVSGLLSSILSKKGITVSRCFLSRDRPFWKVHPWSPPSSIIDPAAVKAYKHYFEKVRPDVVMTWYDYDLSSFWGSILSGIPTIVQAQLLWPVCPKADLFNVLNDSPCKGPSYVCGKCVVKQGQIRGELSAVSPAALLPDVLYATMQLKKMKNLKDKLALANAIVSDSRFLKKTMQTLNYDTGNVNVIYNAVDLKLDPSSEGSRNKKIVLFLSNNASKQKGYHHFVEVSKRLKPSFPDVRFLWVGQNKIHGDSFETMNYVHNKEELLTLYQSSYLLLLPSLWPEPMSYAVLQAMACEKPVVAYDVGANREAVIHNETGLVAEWGNIESLVSCVRTLLLDEKLAGKMGKKAKRRIKEEFSIERMDTAYTGLLKRVQDMQASK